MLEQQRRLGKNQSAAAAEVAATNASASEGGKGGADGIVTVSPSKLGHDDLPDELRAWLMYAPFVLVGGGVLAVLAHLLRQRARARAGTSFTALRRPADLDGDCWLDGLDDEDEEGFGEEGFGAPQAPGSGEVELPGRLTMDEREEL